MSQTVEMICRAVRDMPRRVTNYFLEIEPSIPEKAEYTLVMVRRSQLDLKHGTRYEVTFKEIPEPEDTLLAAE